METRAEDGSGLRVDLGTGQVLQQIPFGKDGEGATRKALAASQSQDDVVSVAPADSEVVDQVSESAPARREKRAAVVIPGRLKSTPVEGLPDGHDKPTAWAHFLGHIKDHEGAVLISASFHNHTRAAALQLAAGDAIKAQGYYHPNSDPARLPTFSVFRLIVGSDKETGVNEAEGEI